MSSDAPSSWPFDDIPAAMERLEPSSRGFVLAHMAFAALQQAILFNRDWLRANEDGTVDPVSRLGITLRINSRDLQRAVLLAYDMRNAFVDIVYLRTEGDRLDLVRATKLEPCPEQFQEQVNAWATAAVGFLLHGYEAGN